MQPAAGVVSTVMGLRRRSEQRREQPAPPADPVGIDRIDLDRYDFDGFRADITEIIDLPKAAQQAAKWALGVPVMVTVLVWLLFAGRMSGWVLVPYALLVFVLALVGAAVLAVFIVARRRVDQTTAAAGRVVELVGLVHGDFERVRTDGARIPLRDVAGLLADEVVFPAVFGVAGQSTTLAGPMGFVLRPALKLPMSVVERKVLAALEQLPAAAETEPGAGPTQDGAAVVGDLAAATDEIVTGVAGEYERVQRRLEQIVGTVGVVALGPVAAFVMISFLPLALLLVLGWWLT